MLRLAICDDEQIHRKTLKDKIIIFSFQNNVDFCFKEFATADELLSAPFNYDILFLDIKLDNNMNGIDIGYQLRERENDCIIILVTLFEQFIRQGYYADAYRYLVKPVKQKELDEALRSSIKKLNRSKAKILVKCLDTQHYFNIEDIIYIESYNRKRYIYLRSKTYETWESLNAIFEKLPHNQFTYPQKSYIVNFDYIISEKMNIITMENKKEISIAKTQLRAFMTALHQYVHLK